MSISQILNFKSPDFPAFLAVNIVMFTLLLSPLLVLFPHPKALFTLILAPVIIGKLLYEHFRVPIVPNSVQTFKNFQNITLAHRGGRPIDNHYFPENSLSAYKWAITSGVYLIPQILDFMTKSTDKHILMLNVCVLFFLLNRLMDLN